MKSTHTLFRPANYVAGEWLTDGDGTHSVVDKYTGTELAALPLATDEQMETAISSACIAFQSFRHWSAGKRSKHLERLRDLIEEHHEQLAQLIMQEAGKPIGYARGEIDRCITTVSLAAGEAIRFTGETVNLDFAAGEGKTAFTKRFPIGVVGCITPFNFPLNLVLHKVAPALAVGCTVVVKPAPQAPLSSLALAVLIEKAGFPGGVFNALCCDVPKAEKLVTDPRISLLSFTGSAKVGWHIKATAGHKKVLLELGGNAPVIIDADADLKKAAKLVAVGSFLYAGQICISTQRIIVHKAVYDAFTKHLIDEVNAMKVGNPAEEGVLVGPLIDGGHAKRVASWVKEAVDGGATVLTGGSFTDETRNVYAPTLLANTQPEMKVSCAEVFGPVAILQRANDFDHAIALANDSEFGLQAGVFTDTFSHVRLAHDELVVGGVIINNVPGFRVDSMPYGGVKDSGNGREGLRYAMQDMTEPRLLVY